MQCSHYINPKTRNKKPLIISFFYFVLTEKMEKRITEDGSVTFYSHKYDETYHSISGAEEEAQLKFAQPCRSFIGGKEGKVKILDICFGIGYNSAAIIDLIKKLNKNLSIELVGIEIDKEILSKIKDLNPNFESYEIIKKVTAKAFEGEEYKEDLISIKIIVGDARDEVKKLEEFDIVLLDPFSLKKCPELWTEEFFANIYKKMNTNSMLVTYSCASLVRKNLEKVGFKVKDGPCVRRRSPSTIAIK